DCMTIRAGMNAVGKLREIVWTWYAFNLLFALVIVAPIVVAIASMLGESLENERLFKNFDISWITEFGYSGHWQQLTVWAPPAAAVGAAYLLMTTWLSGGLLTVLRDPSESFFAGCARWFPPFVRLMLFGLVLYAIAFAFRGGVAALGRKIATDS